ncbi:patatin-like phospholipase family protein [Sphingomonas sp. PB4P5]|uniref:patatin-like phospholipase family protein n=1 Tax=Parasphingomonas puruogangriensis TaxID=3096155 RepID=UPI002FC598FE
MLGGGNALGSYQAGVYQALQERGMDPEWVVGTSAGAINGALIVGNRAANRQDRLAEFWRPDSGQGDSSWWSPFETLRRSAAAIGAMTLGRPGVFGPIGPLGSWWDLDPVAAAPSLFDSKPLALSLQRLVDFELLNAGTARYTAGAVDLQTGEDVFFDSADLKITTDHIRASAALLPTFPPIRIGDRVFVDGGLSNNLPLDPVLGDRPSDSVLCIAVDLLPLAAAAPNTLGEAMSRAQDLMFAAQSRRTIERWHNAYLHDPAFAAASVTLVRLSYANQDKEVAGKAMDFSSTSVRYRWSAGYADAGAMLDRIERGQIPTERQGLTIIDIQPRRAQKTSL